MISLSFKRSGIGPKKRTIPHGPMAPSPMPPQYHRTDSRVRKTRPYDLRDLIPTRAIRLHAEQLTLSCNLNCLHVHVVMNQNPLKVNSKNLLTPSFPPLSDKDIFDLDLLQPQRNNLRFSSRPFICLEYLLEKSDPILSIVHSLILPHAYEDMYAVLDD